jgi:hypothetical protein
MDELYKQYGQLMIQQEILSGRINEIKQRIAQGLQEPKRPVEVKPEAPVV